MIFSDANPVKFWCAGDLTFNETEPEGVFAKCFCQPYECDDEITIQFTDSPGETFRAAFYDEDDVSIGSVDFTAIGSIYQATFIPSNEGICDDVIQIKIVDDDVQVMIAPNLWSDGSDVAGDDFDTRNATQLIESFPTGANQAGSYQPLVIPPGGSISLELIVELSGTWIPTALTVQCSLATSAPTILVSDASDEFTANGTYTIPFTLTNNTASTSSRLYILATGIISSGTVNMTITVPVGQVLYAQESSIVAKSDCISIKSEQKETVLINYSNNRIFTGLSSSVGTPDPEFNLRIPGCFYHERFPTGSEIITLSDGRNIQLNAELTAQKFLEIGLVPYYMHKKIKLALMFQTVTIDGEEWVMKEDYEILTASRRSALKQAKVWLTEKDSTVRNIL